MCGFYAKISLAAKADAVCCCVVANHLPWPELAELPRCERRLTAGKWRKYSSAHRFQRCVVVVHAGFLSLVRTHAIQVLVQADYIDDAERII